MSQGRVVYEEGKLQAQQGTGRFIPRKQFPDYAYQRVKFRNQVRRMVDSKERLYNWNAWVANHLFITFAYIPVWLSDIILLYMYSVSTAIHTNIYVHVFAST